MNVELSIVLVLFFPLCLCRIVEKVETACNGPCGRLMPSCPKGQRVAIRDAVYRVQDKTPGCTPFPGCSDMKQGVCCEPTPQDCVFPYSPMHLRAVLRNCSGNTDCVIQTERSEVETVACSSSEPQNTSSQTALNYVCVDETKIADICSFHDTVVEGKTLFAMVDPRGKREITKGSVCTCMAESTKWPTTNSIAVFLVDLRMSKIQSRSCSQSTLTMRSGNNVKKLDCQSSLDPRVNFPFVAVLNDSNVATLRLEMANHLPEFVWIGFEANEEENIRLTCKLQGVSPNHSVTNAPTTLVDSGDDDNDDDKKDDEAVNENKDTGAAGENTTKKSTEAEERKKSSKKRNKGGSKANAGIVVGALLGAAIFVLLIILLVIIVIRKKRKRYHRSTGLDDVDMDVYHSIDSTLDRSSFKSGGDTDLPKDAQGVGKRKKSNKRVRIVSTPDLMEDHVLPEYTSAVEVRERKRASQRPDLTQTKSNNYDHFKDDINHRQSDLILDSYDQLDCPPPYSSIDGFHGDNKGDNSKKQSSNNPTTSSSSIGGQGQLHGNVNEMYEETEGSNHSQQRHSIFPEESGDLYFELENQSQRETVTYEAPPCLPSAPGPDTLQHNTPKPSVPESNNNNLTIDVSLSLSSSPPPSPTYNEAMSMSEGDDEEEAGPSFSITESPDDEGNYYSTAIDKDNDEMSSPPSQGAEASGGIPKKNEPHEEPRLRSSFPIAAPRKLSTLDSRMSDYYDIAEPIED